MRLIYDACGYAFNLTRCVLKIVQQDLEKRDKVCGDVSNRATTVSISCATHRHTLYMVE